MRMCENQHLNAFELTQADVCSTESKHIGYANFIQGCPKTILHFKKIFNSENGRCPVERTHGLSYLVVLPG